MVWSAGKIASPMKARTMSVKPKKKRSRAFRVHVDADVCDGCGICIFYCKPEVFSLSQELSRRGVYPALPVAQTACNNCGLCDKACPQLAIWIVEQKEQQP